MPTTKNSIVSGYARMWPREVFTSVPARDGTGKKQITPPFLDKAGVYILYRNDMPYYIGQADPLRRRLRNHAKKTDSRYYHFWNFFSAFAVENPTHRNELEGILIAAMPTANSAKPKLSKEKMTKDVVDLLRTIYNYRLNKPT